MIARLIIPLPFKLTIPENAVLKPIELQQGDMHAKIFPLIRSNAPSVFGPNAVITLNDILSFEADILRIDFQKTSFDREDPISMDPPEEQIQSILTNFLSRLRYATESHHVVNLELKRTQWTLEYLDDDESPLPHSRDKFMGKAWDPVKYSYTLATTEVWNNLAYLYSSDFSVPSWYHLLLDARKSTASPGLAIVLAATALEVFIAETLKHLAKESPASDKWWSWINERDYLKQPSLDEQYDDLLAMFLCRSLKENKDLWESFKNLRSARNAFVHEGKPFLGTTELTPAQVTQLVNKAFDAIRLVQSWLPETLKTPRFHYNITLKVRAG